MVIDSTITIINVFVNTSLFIGARLDGTTCLSLYKDRLRVRLTHIGTQKHGFRIVTTYISAFWDQGVIQRDSHFAIQRSAALALRLIVKCTCGKQISSTVGTGAL